MRVVIETFNNGLTVKSLDDKQVFRFEEDSFSDIQEFHCFLDDLLLPMEATGKYSKFNVIHKIVHGRGYECKDKKCPICKGE